MTITDRDMYNQVANALDGSDGDFDVEAIVYELKMTHGLIDIDDVSEKEFWAVVQKHDKSHDKS
jgi:hypothetical protein